MSYLVKGAAKVWYVRLSEHIKEIDLLKFRYLVNIGDLNHDNNGGSRIYAKRAVILNGCIFLNFAALHFHFTEPFKEKGFLVVASRALFARFKSGCNVASTSINKEMYWYNHARPAAITPITFQMPGQGSIRFEFMLWTESRKYSKRFKTHLHETVSSEFQDSSISSVLLTAL